MVKPYPKGDANGWPGWCFPKSNEEYPGATVDPLFRSDYLHEIYFRADNEYKGRYSVPLLWDTVANTIVNNESAEMLRWLPTAFDSVVHPPKKLDLYPAGLAKVIDELSGWMQSDLNTGVYKAGFANSQEAYDRAVPVVFDALNKLEALIAKNCGPFILGSGLTELDIRAYATIVRFDAVYVQHFKCNLGTIRHNYPVINNWLKNLYWDVSGFAESTNFKHIKENCTSSPPRVGIIYIIGFADLLFSDTKSHLDINPKGITPMGPLPPVETGVEKDIHKLEIGHVPVEKLLPTQKVQGSL